MSKLFKCGDCGHISRLEQRKITHAKDCKAIKRRKTDAITVAALKRKSPMAKIFRKAEKQISARMKPAKGQVVNVVGEAKNRKSAADTNQMTDAQVQAQVPAEGELLDREQFIARLLSIKGNRSLHTFAPLLGVSYQFLGHVVKGDMPPGPKIAGALGFTQDVYFRYNPTLAKKAVRPAAPDKRQMKLPIDGASHAATAGN